MRKLMLLFSLAVAVSLYAASPGYHVIKRIQVGGESGWDYLTVDGAAKRLYVSHATHVVVVDLAAGKVAGDIPGTSGVHGIALAPELGRGFISCGRADTVVVFDLKTLEVLDRVPAGSNPDAILYDPASSRVFAFNGRSHNATVIEAATGKVAGTIELDGKPEFARADGSGKVYVNIEDKSEVAEIDSRTLAVTRRFPLAPGEEPSGMGFDIKHHRIYSGCGNKVMTVLDTETGKVIATVPIGEDCGGAGFDPGTGLAFASCGDGTLAVVQETSPGKFEVVETVTTQSESRTMTVDPTTHIVYAPAAEYTQPPAKATAGLRHRRTVIADSFSILVIGK